MLDLLQQRKKEYHLSFEEKIIALTEQICVVEKLKFDAEQQLMSELEKSSKTEKLLNEELQSVKIQLKYKEQDLKTMNEKLATIDRTHTSEMNQIQVKLKEQSSMLKEYQDVVIIDNTI